MGGRRNEVIILRADHDPRVHPRSRGAMTEGFALGFGWLIYLGLLACLVYFLLRAPR
jgi:hypothetical protein